MSNHNTIKPTKEELSNGWNAASLAAYRLERDKVAAVVSGNVVTEFKRGKQPIRMEGVKGYDPFTRSPRPSGPNRNAGRSLRSDLVS
jgi:hypothetical protein